MSDTSDLAQLLATAERLSPERLPTQAVTLNKQILSLDPQNAAAYVRLARAYQAQRQFAAAVAACQAALQQNPHSSVAQKRMQRIQEEWALAKEAEAITTFHTISQSVVERMVITLVFIPSTSSVFPPVPTDGATQQRGCSSSFSIY